MCVECARVCARACCRAAAAASGEGGGETRSRPGAGSSGSDGLVGSTDLSRSKVTRDM